ncbi:hypothetical protein B0H17DRAFT_1215463 [Mycena rosella]|uniref:Uncharacterized protein n=1 Tax=Mycena rosella TaxID=1033263 RepID=A0AAD7FXQ5_MYCRO|nr:hypothetical protein B0H17DRAFT_1215463 [Mycena rosella]
MFPASSNATPQLIAAPPRFHNGFASLPGAPVVFSVARTGAYMPRKVFAPLLVLPALVRVLIRSHPFSHICSPAPRTPPAPVRLPLPPRTPLPSCRTTIHPVPDLHPPRPVTPRRIHLYPPPRHDTEGVVGIAHIKDRLQEGYPIDFQDIVSRFTMDASSEFLFGHNATLPAGLPYPLYATRPSRSAPDSPSTQFAAALNLAQLIAFERFPSGPSWP